MSMLCFCFYISKLYIFGFGKTENEREGDTETPAVLLHCLWSFPSAGKDWGFEPCSLGMIMHVLNQ